MSLLGRSWLDVLVPSWKANIIQPLTPETVEKKPTAEEKIKAIEKSLSVEDKVMALAKEFPSVFSSNIKEPVRDFEANVVVKEDATLIVHKPYPVPFAVKEKAEVELRRMVSEGILIPVMRNEIASPIVGL